MHFENKCKIISFGAGFLGLGKKFQIRHRLKFFFLFPFISVWYPKTCFRCHSKFDSARLVDALSISNFPNCFRFTIYFEVFHLPSLAFEIQKSIEVQKKKGGKTVKTN